MAWKIRYYFIVGLCLLFLIGTPLGMFVYGYSLPDAFPFSVWIIEIVILSAGMLGVILDFACNVKKWDAVTAKRVEVIGILGLTWFLVAAGIVPDKSMFLHGAKLRFGREIDPRKLQSWADLFPNASPKPKNPSHPDYERTITFHLHDGEALVAGADFDNGIFVLQPESVPTNIANVFSKPTSVKVEYASGQSGERYVSIGNCFGRFGLYIRVESPGSPRMGPLFTQNGPPLQWQDRVYICINGGG